MVVENIGGAGGGVGAAQASRSRPDGYTLLLGGATTHITEALLKTKPTYDPLKDLEPISPIAVTAFAIAVHPSVPAKDLKEFIAYVKANPGKVSYGSAGHGSLNHLTGELFKLRAGLDRSAARAVSRRGAGLDRPAGRANPLVGAGDDQHRAGASPRRQIASAGGDAPQASRRRARTADHRSSRAFPTSSRRTSSACSRRPACRATSSARCRPPT